MVVKHAKVTSNPTEGKSGKQERRSGRLTSSRPTQSIPPTILSIGSPAKQKTDNSVQPKILKEECVKFNSNHKLQDCKKFAEMPLTERSDFVKQHGCCLQCLARGHLGRDCSSSKKCGVEDCQHSHHRLLHGTPRIFIKLPSNSSTEGAASKIPKKNDKGAGESTGSTYCYTCAIHEKDKNWSVLLPVVPITIWSDQQRFDTFGLLDTGSEITLILNHTADTIGLEGEVEIQPETSTLASLREMAKKNSCRRKPWQFHRSISRRRVVIGQLSSWNGMISTTWIYRLSTLHSSPS
jgi:hypothetical protein